MRVILVTLCASAVFGQAPASTPKFDLASIRPSPRAADVIAAGKTPHAGTTMDGSRVDSGMASLSVLIATAFRVEPYQISGPDRMSQSRFDIVAKLPANAAKEQVPEMLRSLLAERFNMVARRESQDQSVYVLLVDKGGPKLKESAPDAGSSDKPFPNGAGGRIMLKMFQGPDSVQTYSLLKGVMLFETEKIAMPDLARALMGYVDIPFLDTTGLKGNYEVAMTVPRPPNGGRGGVGRGGDDASEPSGVSIFCIGLKTGIEA